jgi:hypothetical protein
MGLIVVGVVENELALVLVFIDVDIERVALPDGHDHPTRAEIATAYREGLRALIDSDTTGLMS